jgi:hypothetical protein
VHCILESLLRGGMQTPAALNDLVAQQPQAVNHAKPGN